MKPLTIFITGVPGSGKSSITKRLHDRLGVSFKLYDLDQRGVPDNVDISWRANETKYWEGQGEENAKQGIGTVVLGFTLPEEAGENSKFILLDVNAEALSKRLQTRYEKPNEVQELKRMTGQTPEQSIESQMSALPWLRGKCQVANACIIDTSDLDIEQIAQQVSEHIKTITE